MQFEVGQKAGDYEFLEVVESGATGVTYRVRNSLADRLELLKVLPRDLQEDSERVERFLREAKIHARLHHPNIAAFYNATHLDDQLVMTSELVEGTSLAQRIASGSLSLEQAAKYFEQALAALSYAHQEGVVHRDITPGRLMITPNDGVKVTGFGLAKKPADPQLTQPGIVMGSMHYMSPEQVKGSSELDRRSDIYSLGVVLYEAVTGRKPFDAKSDFEVFMAHVNQEPPPPSSVRAGIPPEMDQIIRTAMAKQPADRFQTAEDFRGSLGKLQGVLAGPPAGPSAAEARTTVPQRDTVDPWGSPPPSSGASPGVADPRAGLRDAATESEASQPEISSSRQTPIPFQPRFERSHEPASPRPEHGIPAAEPAAQSRELFSRGVTPEPAGQEYRSALAAPRAEPHAELARSAPAQPFHDTWPDEEVAESPRGVPLLLRSTEESPSSQASPAVTSPQRRREPAPEPLGDQTFAGWTTKDVLAVGALTFVIVAAVFFAMLTFLNR
jgi:serine/threonine-protein kinase